jgi:hypothetical protein
MPSREKPGGGHEVKGCGVGVVRAERLDLLGSAPGECGRCDRSTRLRGEYELEGISGL